MYIPSLFKFENEKEKVAFMQQYSFPCIVTTKDNVPIATQLPFVVKKIGDKIVLSGHFGVANEQAKYIEDNLSLVIFSEPHAYISPKHYDKHESVPTWDYIAVHAYGKAVIIHDHSQKLDAIEEMIQYYEKDYQEQWNGLSVDFKERMLKGIVAFQIEVSDLQGQQKLSQNKSEKELERIVDHLKNSSTGTERELAPYIEKISK